MGKTFKEMRSNHAKPNKRHPHKDDKFYKDEFHPRKGGKPVGGKGKNRGREIDGFDL
jgi:hypothetical protein